MTLTIVGTMNRVFLLLMLLFTIVAASSFPLEKVSITGNRKTKDKTILKIAKLDSLSTTCNPDTVKQRLLNRQLFAEVSVDYDSISKELSIKIRESLTLQPIISGKKSTGVFNFRLGLGDINFLGRDMIVGGYYDNYASSNNFKINFQKNNIGPKRITLGISALKSAGNYIWYTSTGDLEAGFRGDKTVISLISQLPFYIKEREFNLGFTTNFLDQKLSTDDIADTLKELNSNNRYNFPDSTKGILPTLSLLYSTININTFLVNGWATKLSVTRSILYNKLDYFSIGLLGQYYKRLPFSSNLCINAHIKGLSSKSLTSLYYIGHSNGIRGYYNNEFRGKAFAQLNTELRISQIKFKLLKRYQFIVQPTIFFDALAISEKASGLLKDSRTATSIGSGIRVVSPSISGFMLNLDYAIGLGDNIRYNYYIGTSYYFKPMR